VPGDDCAALLWIPRDQVPEHPRISQGIRDTVRDLKL
jgi:hypothetical protein